MLVTITTLILLLATGILTVTLVHGQLRSAQTYRLINNCCKLGYGRFTFSRKTKPLGLYVIPNYCKNDHLEAEAYCDTSNGGGGWLVVQRRQDGSVDFNKTWLEYEDGFGKLTGMGRGTSIVSLVKPSRWLGNENGHKVN